MSRRNLAHIRKVLADAIQPRSDDPTVFSRPTDIKGGELLRQVEEEIATLRSGLPRGGPAAAALSAEIRAWEELGKDIEDAATATSAEDFWAEYTDRRRARDVPNG